MSAADLASFAAIADAAADGAASEAAALAGAALSGAALAGADDEPLLEHAANRIAVIPNTAARLIFLFCT